MLGMTNKSIRSQVFEFLNGHPKISLRMLTKEFKDCNRDTIKRYLTQYREQFKVESLGDMNIKNELTKIIKDYKQPASARVQAIREYNNLVEITPESSDDPLLKLLTTLEKES